MDKKKILIVDDDENFGRTVKLNLEALGEYKVVVETDGAHALSTAKSVKPDLMLLDLKMCDKGGFEVLEDLKADTETASIPVIILTVIEGHLQKIKAVQLHSEGYMIKPVSTVELKAKIERVLKKHSECRDKDNAFTEKKPAGKAVRKKILIFDDDENFGRMIKLNLEALGEYKVTVETEGSRACSVAQDFKPDLILLDIRMPGKDGFEILTALRQDSNTKLTPIVMLTALDDEESRRKSKELYSEDYITKPIATKELTARIEDILERHRDITG